jgi:hydroxypyruvate isomerase
MLKLFVPQGAGPVPVVVRGDAGWHHAGNAALRELLGRGYVFALFNRVDVAPDPGRQRQDLLTTEALDDLGANPQRSWQSHRAAQCVFDLLSAPRPPAIDFRADGHAQADADGRMLLDHAGALNGTLRHLNTTAPCGLGYHLPMPQFAANLSWLYTDLPFLDRFDAAARDGFSAVECMFPYEVQPAELARRLHDLGLQMVLFNGPPGTAAQAAAGLAADTRGTAALPGREADFRGSVELTLEYAAALQCPRIHLMAGLMAQGPSPQAMHATYIDNLRWATNHAAKAGVQVLIEPINARDNPGYFLYRQDQAHAIVQEVGSDQLKVQMDIYHCQIVEGDLTTMLRQYLPTGRVGHLQIAGVPQRHEPDVGEVNYDFLFSVLDELGYDGWIGCEYKPRDTTPGGTSRGLGWVKPWL